MADVPIPALPAEARETDRLILRDGSTAGVRLAAPLDRDAMRQFFANLSPESLRRRFLAASHASEALIAQLCDNSDPRQALTLIVCRQLDGAIHIIGIGSYFAVSDGIAEAAFAVDDTLHGKGIATALLDRLAQIALDYGFHSFEATVLGENHEMLDVFRDSGFQIRKSAQQGCVDLLLSLSDTETHARAADGRDRIATVASLKPMLEPTAVAIIGASRDQSNLGRRVFDALMDGGFTGAVYPVNPAVTELRGVQCRSSARELPTGVDLAVIAVPADRVPSVVDDCAAAGVKAVAVISAAFAEDGDAGRARQVRLVEQVRSHGMRMLGPNCMGLFNTARRLNASFAEQLPPPGRIALASQSGGLGLAILNLARTRHIGLSWFASLGNKADVSGNDILQYAEGDDGTSVVLLYLESFGNPRRFGQIARRVSRTKPIVVVKAGRSDAGTRAATSHTAGLAANDVTVKGLFRQSGVIRADTIDEMFDVAACLDAQPIPGGGRVAIVSNAGGPGILAADACAAAGLDVLPTAGSLSNPIDLLASGTAADYRRTIEKLLTAADVDALLVIYTTIDSHHNESVLLAIQEGVIAARAGGFVTKPVVVCTMATTSAPALHAANETIPVYPFPEQAARALGKAAEYGRWRRRDVGTFPTFDDAQIGEARTLCRQILDERDGGWLTSEELHRLLNLLGIALSPGVLAHTADEAAGLAHVFGFPVVAKLVSAQAVHKNDVDGVRLNLNNESVVRAAFSELSEIGMRTLANDVEGVLIQPMIRGGTETLVGLTQDPLFGPLVAFGLGGVNVEVCRDVAFRIAPLTDRDADELMRDIRGFELLRGHRGHAPADLDALGDLILRVAFIADRIPELRELEFNPVMALAPGSGCQIVDARARVGLLPHGGHHAHVR